LRLARAKNRNADSVGSVTPGNPEWRKNMNDNQFEALLDALKDIGAELMFIRDELSGLRDIYGQANGFESLDEQTERIVEAMRNGKPSDDTDDK